jgi:hypothetical protein
MKRALIVFLVVAALIPVLILVGKAIIALLDLGSATTDLAAAQKSHDSQLKAAEAVYHGITDRLNEWKKAGLIMKIDSNDIFVGRDWYLLPYDQKTFVLETCTNAFDGIVVIRDGFSGKELAHNRGGKLVIIPETN